MLVAWNDTDEALRFAGARVRPSDTPAERVAVVENVLDGGGVATLERLAHSVDVAAYAPPRLSEADAEAAAASMPRKYAAWRSIPGPVAGAGSTQINPRRLRGR